MSNSKAKPTTSFRLDPETARLLEALSQKLAITKVNVLRRAIRELAKLESLPY